MKEHEDYSRLTESIISNEILGGSTEWNGSLPEQVFSYDQLVEILKRCCNENTGIGHGMDYAAVDTPTKGCIDDTA